MIIIASPPLGGGARGAIFESTRSKMPFVTSVSTSPTCTSASTGVLSVKLRRANADNLLKTQQRHDE